MLDTVQDTVTTIVFTCEDSTLAYPTTSPVTADTLRIKDQHRCSADSASAWYRLGVAGTVPFAWTVITKADTNGLTADFRVTPKSPASFWSPDSLTGNVMLNTRGTVNNRVSLLMYVPFEDYIPAGARITQATIFFTVGVSAISMQSGDTLVATLMDAASDSVWHGNTEVAANYPDFAGACYNRQRSLNGGAWGGVEDWDTDGNEWGKRREKLWHWGKVCDWTGSELTGSSTRAVRRAVPVQFPNCLQAIVDGGVNNGIKIDYVSAARSAEAFGVMGGTAYSAAIRRTPYIVIRYTLRPQHVRWGDDDIAVVLATQHGRLTNEAYADTVRDVGGKLSMFVSRREVQEAETGADPLAMRGKDIIDLWAGGSVEVGSLSRQADATNGLNKWVKQYVLTDTLSAAWDSLTLDVSPAWMYTMADTCGLLPDLHRNSFTYAKALALPFGKFGPEVLLASRLAGYRAIMSSADRLALDREKYYQPASVRAAACDSLVLGMPRQSKAKPRSTAAFPSFCAVEYIVGLKGNTGTHVEAEVDSVRWNMERALWQARGQQRGAIMLLFSDDKNGTVGDGSASPREVGSIASAVNQFGAAWLTLTEYADIVRGHSASVSTPASFAQSDTSRIEAGQQVWFKEE